MSEAASIDPESAMSATHEHRHEIAEIIEFPTSATERAVGSFIDTAYDSVMSDVKSQELAVAIGDSLSGKTEHEADDDIKLVRELISHADAFGDSDLYDHKSEHDPVFAKLVTVLQSTKHLHRSLHEQRRAALRLTELRAALEHDETTHDEKWHTIINRLFD